MLHHLCNIIKYIYLKNYHTLAKNSNCTQKWKSPETELQCNRLFPINIILSWFLWRKVKFSIPGSLHFLQFFLHLLMFCKKWILFIEWQFIMRIKLFKNVGQMYYVRYIHLFKSFYTVHHWNKQSRSTKILSRTLKGTWS